MNNDLISRSEFRRSLIIWAEKLHIAGECGGCEVELMQAVIRMLDAQAAVDAEPTRHGKWLFSDYDYFTCSVCGGQYLTDADSTKDAEAMLENNAYYPYCPYCGASMKGEKNHE